MKKRTFRLLLPALLFSMALAQQPSQLTIQTERGKQVVFSQAEIESVPHVKVTAPASHGSDASVTFEGVTLQSVLERAGITFGESLRGKRLASCLLVEAADGYRVVIALPEIDQAFTNRQIVLAYSEDGNPLDTKQRPYRIIIPDEKGMAVTGKPEPDFPMADEPDAILGSSLLPFVDSTLPYPCAVRTLKEGIRFSGFR